MRIDVDYRRLERDLDHIGRKALPQAAAGYLNGIAFAARDQLIQHNSEAFDGHVPFTDKAWVVDKAKPSDGINMGPVVKAQPRQANYLQFQIFGTKRETGDSGSGPYDLFVFGAKTNRAGNIRPGYARELAKRNREEKAARASWREQKPLISERRKWDMSGDYAMMSDMSFRSRFKGAGIFFGEVGGVKGYWQRPSLTKATKKRKKGVISVRPKGNSKLTPLLTVSEFARYQPRFKYDAQVQKAARQRGSTDAFRREFDRAMQRLPASTWR